MKKVLGLIVIVIIIGACSPSPEAVQKALEQTQAAMPTATNTEVPTLAPTETPIPEPTNTATLEPTATATTAPTNPPVPVSMGQPDLGAVLYLEGDLPDGYKLKETSKVEDDDFSWIDDHGTDTYYLKFSHGDVEYAGNVAVFVYEDLNGAILAYTADLNEISRAIQEYSSLFTFQFEMLENLGYQELGYYFSADSTDEKLETVGFVRCNAYVRVNLLDTMEKALVLNYATKLEQRMIDLGCSE